MPHSKKDLHWYLRQLEEVVCRVLRSFGLTPRLIAGTTGVWVDNYKVCALGLAAKRWMTYHGIGLNVSTDLAAFSHITPCGLDDPEAFGTPGSLEQLLETPPDMFEVKQAFLKAFSDVFQVPTQYCEDLSILDDVLDENI